MKKYRDPVNHILSSDEIESTAFTAFMNGLTDVPESEPLFNVSIDEAGITEQQHILYTTDFADVTSPEPLFADIEMSVSLKNNRGIHMSRCEEVLFEFKNKKDLTLIDMAVSMSKRLQEVQGAENAFVTLIAQKALKKSTRVTKKDTFDKIFIYAKASATSSGVQRDIGLTAYNMTACPCTKTHTKFSVVPSLVKLGLELGLIQKVIDITKSGTHTQRGTISVKIENASAELKVESLYKALDKSTHLVNELLKRPDEHDLVTRALDKPQFTEDVVREVAINLANDFQGIVDPLSHVEIESILHDSIHIHNVKTVIRRNFGRLCG
jgi:GTP cyclohydrolase IV